MYVIKYLYQGKEDNVSRMRSEVAAAYEVRTSDNRVVAAIDAAKTNWPNFWKALNEATDGDTVKRIKRTIEIDLINSDAENNPLGIAAEDVDDILGMPAEDDDVLGITADVDDDPLGINMERKTMAKAAVKKAAKPAGKRDVTEDLIGGGKPNKKTAAPKVAPKVKKAANGRSPKIDDLNSKTIKIVKNKERVKKGTTSGDKWLLIKSGMKVGDWRKACVKKGLPGTGAAVLRGWLAEGNIKLV